MMGERSSPFISGITVLLICVQLLCFSESQSITCTMPSVKEGQTTTLTVEFGFNLQDEEHHRDVIIKRLRGTTGETEDLVDCYWDIKDYRCKVKNSRFYFNNHITENMTLLLPHASKEDAGKYFIMVTGSKINSCSFSLGDGDSGPGPDVKTTTLIRPDANTTTLIRPDVNTTTLIRPDENTTTLNVVTVVMVVSLLLNLAVGIRYLIKKRRGKWSTRNNGVNSALARLLPCWSREEAKMPVQATDLGEKDSKDGEEENPEGKDATETDKLQGLVEVRD